MSNIIWQTKLELDGKMIEDPNSQARTVIVTLSELEKSIKVMIFNRTFESVTHIEGNRCDSYLEFKYSFPNFNKNFRKFMKLRHLILAQYQHREAKTFLRKLSSIFPNLLDSHIFG